MLYIIKTRHETGRNFREGGMLYRYTEYAGNTLEDALLFLQRDCEILSINTYATNAVKIRFNLKNNWLHGFVESIKVTNHGKLIEEIYHEDVNDDCGHCTSECLSALRKFDEEKN